MKKERQEQLSEARTAQREYQALLESAGWKRLQEEIAAQINKARDYIETKLPESMDDMLKRESVLGEIRAGRRIIQLPEIQLENARAVVQAILSEPQPEEEESEDVYSDE